MNVTACLVTRGDVDMQPILDSLPGEWEVVVYNNHSDWDNAASVWTFHTSERKWEPNACGAMPDLSVYGRYAAIAHASNDLIYVQDDDVIVSDPQAIVNEWVSWNVHRHDREGPIPSRLATDHVVCNMPMEFRHDFYKEHALVGFGACFHRDAPARAWQRVGQWRLRELEAGRLAPRVAAEVEQDSLVFGRCCDVVLTALTPRILVDVPKENLEYATADNRMYRQAEHVGERKRMLELALKVRGA